MRIPAFLHRSVVLLAAGCAVAILPCVSPSAAAAQTSGGLNTTFNTGVGANDAVLAVAAQSDGKTILGGKFTKFNDTACGHLIRLNTDGSPDTTFLAGVGADASVYDIAFQSDGKVVLAGNFVAFDGVAQNHVARLNTDGSLDKTFLIGTGANAAVNSVAVQGDDKIILGGALAYFNGTRSPGVVRLNADGSADTTFQSALTYSGGVPPVLRVALQSSGRVIVAGSGFLPTADSAGFISSMAVVRLGADGSLDSTFTAGFPVESDLDTDAVTDLAVQPDDQMICVGYYINSYPDYPPTNSPICQRLQANGLRDESFNPSLVLDSGQTATATAVKLQADGKIIIADMSAIDGLASGNVSRFASDGTLDTTFATAKIAGIGVVNGIALQPSGSVVLGGDFLSLDGTAVGRVARLNGPLSTVTIVVAGDGMAVEGGENGKVAVVRTGDTSAPLTVFYKAKGSAKQGTDIKPLAGSAVIPAGASKVKVKIKPIDDDVHETSARKVNLRLLPASDDSYVLGDPAVAKIRIIDND